MAKRIANRATPSANSATYLYCLVESKQPPSLKGMPQGLPGIQKPRPLHVGDSLWLIVGDAPLSRYGTEPIEAGLADLDWVADCAVAHERVIEQVKGTVVPMKLFTLFSSDARALAHIAGSRRKLHAAIRRIAGCQEWGVRILLDVSGSKKSNVREASSGTGFLLAKKKQRDRALDLAQRALSDAEAAYRDLTHHAKAAQRLPIVKGEGERSRVILNAAFLVASEEAKKFQRACQQIAARFEGTCRVAISGPWPPYNFIEKRK